MENPNESGVKEDNSLLAIRRCSVTCVEFPGLVSNPDRMLEMIGGEKAVSSAYTSATKRLEMKWRPDEVYCKSLYGDRIPTTAMMMKVTRQKRRRPDGSVYTTMKVELSGPIMSSYKFVGMADYQYLPMVREAGQYRSLRPDLIITQLEHSSWLDKPSPLFLVPPYFSRIDQPVQYAYRKEPEPRKRKKLPEHFLGISRERRLHYSTVYTFGDPIPQAPQEGALKNLSEKDLKLGNIEEIRKLFEQRPIWSRNAILCHYSGHPNKLKFVLPVVAYYCMNGPWRTCWIRYGFDPTMNPEAKLYQTLDYRIRQRAGEKLVISQSKRSPFFYALPNKTSKRSVVARTSHFRTVVGEAEQAAKSMDDSICKYRPDQVPPYRQMFYQICDVLSDEIQTLLHQNDGKEEETGCSERDGWLPEGTIAQCRAIIGQNVDKLRSQSNSIRVFANPKKGGSRRHIDAKRNMRPKHRARSLLEEDSNEEDDLEEGPGDPGEGTSTQGEGVGEDGEELGDREEENAMEAELMEMMTGVDENDDDEEEEES